MTQEEPRDPSCPSCKSPLDSNAILCVACGYNLKTGQFLRTDLESTTTPLADMANPYASPAADIEPPDTGEFDLDEHGARKASAVVAGGKLVYPALALCVCCFPVWLALLPYYAYLLWSWYSLRQKYSELRNPNSFSPNGKLASDFLGAWFALVCGVCIGGVILALTVYSYLLRNLR